jgi:hypothetical protein
MQVTKETGVGIATTYFVYAKKSTDEGTFYDSAEEAIKYADYFDRLEAKKDWLPDRGMFRDEAMEYDNDQEVLGRLRAEAYDDDGPDYENLSALRGQSFNDDPYYDL